MTLVEEAERFASYDLARARGIRNGLMIALLALCPVRLKNYAALEIGETFKEVSGMDRPAWSPYKNGPPGRALRPRVAERLHRRLS